MFKVWMDLKKKDNSMKIDYNKLKSEAKRTGVNIFLLIKRLLQYGKKVGWGMCKNCEHVCIPKINNISRMQCVIIGVGDDFYADINPFWCCKKGYKIRREKLKVISDFIKNYKED